MCQKNENLSKVYRKLQFIFSVAIKGCWASTVENERTGGDTGGIDFDAAGATINGNAAPHETVKFYDDMCPAFNWVSSFADHNAIQSNTEISLRQFDFNGATSGEFFYHCEVFSTIKCLFSSKNILKKTLKNIFKSRPAKKGVIIKKKQ